MTVNDHTLTVFYDGSCPLCIREITLLRRALPEKSAINFEDVSAPDAVPSCDIAKSKLMARFHCQLPDGKMVNGAQAFTEVWGRVRFMEWLKPVGRFGPSRAVLNALYALFLKVRPGLQRITPPLKSK
ncbi:thiol-disulfide oxidoreductase DCC family protein [Parvularcula sp. IMCC14364]|uniref:thiol-disulfide oxidoreductase DCC family protein n=1 Tax=Parvularcula sp. IMCC14364 TaxID=3067902 RepID=UPI002741D660|nr:DUF393 domain-containing protein [Parvularcula sp. IMCC14364]